MPIIIDTPESPWTTQKVTLSNLTYQFTYKYNERNDRMYLDIFFSEEPLVTGLKLVENGSLLKDYALEDFDHGDIYCLKVQDDGSHATLGNIGINKAYQLMYFTNEEIEEVRNG